MIYDFIFKCHGNFDMEGKATSELMEEVVHSSSHPAANLVINHTCYFKK